MTRHPLTRRQVLAGLGTVGLASAGAGVGTSALFSDSEAFEGNAMTAGELDLKLTWWHRYFGADGAEEYGTAGRPEVSGVPDRNGDGRRDPIRSRQQLRNRNPGFTEEQIEAAFRDQFTDVDGSPLIELTDVKPGDRGRIDLGAHLFTNPGYLWLTGRLVESRENGVTEPEADSGGEDDPEGPTSGDDDPARPAGTGELADAIVVAVRQRFGNRYRLIRRGTLREVLEWLATDPALDADRNTAGRQCFPGDETAEFRIRWQLPASVGNEVQSDSVAFDLGIYGEQCRNHDGTGGPAS